MRPLVALLRDERVVAGLVQAAVALLAALLVGYVAWSVYADLSATGIAPGLGFLGNEAGFAIGEGPAFDESESYGRALLVALANTLRVALAGIVLATIWGFLVALARLSRNPLASRLARAYIELFRNTPLLAQLLFWYLAIITFLPPIADALPLLPRTGPEGETLAWLLLSQRGAAIAWPAARGAELAGLPGGMPGGMSGGMTGPALAFWAAVLLGLALGYGLYRWRLRVQARTGRPARGLLLGGLAWLAVVLLAAWWLRPYAAELPALGRFRYQGGAVLSPEYTALLIGLVAYTGAFVAEVIRAGIQSVTRGQREAARALGLHEGQVLRLVVMPQALRVIVPPLTNQYLNLTKNSSLGIFVGYPDLFQVGMTVANQTGQAVSITLLLMVVYLSISLFTSLLMNLYGRRIRLVER